MDLSRNWLNEFVDLTDISDKDFCDAMTLSGSKVETLTRPADEIKNVVAGRILTMERHPDSDHMWVCHVDVGHNDPVQIVTGAWNVHPGDMAPAALDGAVLPGGATIRSGTLRGVMSDGMLCSLKELGLTAEHDFPYAGIKPAALLNDYKPLDKNKPSISPDIAPGDKIFGAVIAARVTKVTGGGYAFTAELDTGSGALAVATDRQNIHEGDLVAFDTKAEKILSPSDLRAQPSEFPHCIEDGIFILDEPDAAPGVPMAKLLGFDDSIVEFEITPNRPDCLSVIGLAREASATFSRPIKLHTPEVKGCGGNIADLVDIEIEDGDLCPRYTARLVKNVKIAPSPRWLRERLRNSGVRPINNIVDITNYVMLEYGQPMHAFDFSCVDGGKIVVRTARPGETIQTLDGGERKLTENMLCICDTHKPVCVAGVMGGANSEIIGDTAMVLFESANFNGVSVRRTATALGMRTDASSRYEKGLDPMQTYAAVQRACELVEMLGAGEVVDGFMDVVAKDITETTVKLEPDRINALLGTDLDRAFMEKALLSLGFTLDGDTIKVPSWRGDVSHYSDIAEEVARMYGYNKIPYTLMRGETTRGGFTEMQRFERALGETCRTLGCDEIITYSFISPSCYDKIRLPADSPKRKSLKILNPLGEDTSIMRTTILPSLLEIVTRNYNYRNKAVRLYELGKIYLPREDGLADEPKILSLGAYGDDADFFTLKGYVETIIEALRIENARYEACADNPSYHPGRCARVYAGDTLLGVFGQIHPLVAENYGVDTEIFAAELAFDALWESRGGAPEYVPLPKYPSIARDIAVVCAEDVTIASLSDCIRRAGGKLLKNVELFDIYRGSHIAEGKKSTAFSLTLRSDEQTLTDDHADEVVGNILEKLKAELGAIIR